MSDYILNRDAEGKVGYLYVNDGKHPVVGRTKFENARWMIGNDKRKVPRMSGEYAGYPLTADGVYFFDGAIEQADDAVDEARNATGDGGVDAAATEDVAPVCGPDWCEIPELAEKPKKKGRRAKGAEGANDGE